MNALKEVLQTTLIKTKLTKHKISNKSMMVSKMAVTRLKYFLRQSLKFEKKLTCSYDVRGDSVLMKDNQRDITNNIFRNLICLRAAALWERETGTMGDNSKSSCTVMNFISAVCINFIFAKPKT